MSDPDAHIGMTYIACQCHTREAACVAVGCQIVRHVEHGNLALAEHGRSSFGLASVYGTTTTTTTKARPDSQLDKQTSQSSRADSHIIRQTSSSQS